MFELAAKYGRLIEVMRQLYGAGDVVPLHAPYFGGNEKKYLLDCIDSTYVSSVGAYVDKFERMMCELTGARYAVATSNGTSALHMALILAGVRTDDEVVTQPLSFVATCNAVSYQHAHPVFVDVERETFSLCPDKLEQFFNEFGVRRAGGCFNRESGRRIAAVVPMHTFGLPARIKELTSICDKWGVPLIEDAAESIGSTVDGVHTGRFGLLAAFSFNGNKTLTCGGGGCIITDDERLARLGKHLTTTAKVPHKWDFFHDQVGYNYRLPNLNAALACAQLEQLPLFLSNKRETAMYYQKACAELGISFAIEREGTSANYWLNAVVVDSLEERDAFLAKTNREGIMTRPVWTLMNRLPAFAHCLSMPLDNAAWLEARLINVPSSYRPS